MISFRIAKAISSRSLAEMHRSYRVLKLRSVYSFLEGVSRFSTLNIQKGRRPVCSSPYFSVKTALSQNPELNNIYPLIDRKKILELANKWLQNVQAIPHSKAELAPLKEYIKEVEMKIVNMTELELLIKDESSNMEMVKLAKAELEEDDAVLHDLEHKILSFMLSHGEVDEMDDSNVILEITSGIGGQEAMLFASDLFNMYIKFINNNKWNILSTSSDENTSAGGMRHGYIIISGHRVFPTLKYEGGIHRVQRVPKTEKAGRIHTSTVAVAVLPQPTEIQVVINQNDLKIETKRASGAGGQHVNTTDSAVRIVHIPTGIIVENQTERSQIRNKELALQRLRSLIYEQQREKQLATQRGKRKLQVGTRARSEKVRTYNFLQDRVTDHRIGLACHNIVNFMNGGEELGVMMEALQAFACKEHLQAILDNMN